MIAREKKLCHRVKPQTLFSVGLCDLFPETMKDVYVYTRPSSRMTFVKDNSVTLLVSQSAITPMEEPHHSILHLFREKSIIGAMPHVKNA